MRLGFIGTGIITKAVVTGMCRFGVPFDGISLSPRNPNAAAELATLDERIRVCASNQEVLENSDVVCLAVVPQIASEVLGELEFGSRHHIVSFIAGISLAELRRVIPQAGSRAQFRCQPSLRAREVLQSAPQMTSRKPFFRRWVKPWRWTTNASLTRSPQ
ncbi:NAD(P)-binding domain-containing protein [Paraburkholderia phymatum]|uniref:NAD(P)-binding domain-containing protein n=1 Tax=Paraburkholderia phymatum TaxID=148447 RepID=A0ACC6U380_9BURK